MRNDARSTGCTLKLPDRRCRWPGILEQSRLECVMALGQNSTSAVHLHANTSIAQDAQLLLLYRVAVGLEKYYLPTICIVGFIGNVMSLIVLLQRHNRRLSCCLYLGGLAVNDNLIIYIAMHYWTVMSLHVGTLSDFQCQWIAYIFHVSTRTFTQKAWTPRSQTFSSFADCIGVGGGIASEREDLSRFSRAPPTVRSSRRR